MSQQLPRVVIVGRPNVGKSDLFNRIHGERKAIVEDEPGTTRDRVEAEIEWKDTRFRLVDTGGYETSEENVFGALIIDQIVTGVATADLVLFCVDVRDGLTATDFDVARVVREAGRPYLLVATKADNQEREDMAIAETAALGLGEPIAVSSLHNANISWLLDEVAERLPPIDAAIELDRIRVAIIGRPNVGKSMLVNAVLGESRVIVSNIAGTTRDAVDTEIDREEGAFTLVDTAGIRRPGKLGKGVERHSVMRAKDVVLRADVAILVVDGTEGVTSQDMHIAGLALEAHTGLIIAVNKTDLWEDPAERRDWIDRQMRGRLRFLPWALITFISALEGRGIPHLLELAANAREARRRRVSTGELNTLLKRAVQDRPPPVVHHRRLKLYYATQADIDPPVFVLFVNDPGLVHFGYRRYLERIIRTAYDFEGTSIVVGFRSRASEDDA